jgi:hypothetical protein
MFRRFTFAAVLFAAVALSVSPSVAQDKGMAMPPGMTPELMKMMMTPGAPHPKGLPVDVVPVAGCIPSMGYHYASAKNWPTGPIYGYYKGKPVFTEVMLTQKAFASESGVNMDAILKPLPGYTINHVDIWFEAHGHPGMTTPHYDIHAWYIPHSEHMTFCKNASGKRPTFV